MFFGSVGNSLLKVLVQNMDTSRILTDDEFIEINLKVLNDRKSRVRVLGFSPKVSNSVSFLGREKSKRKTNRCHSCFIMHFHSNLSGMD